MQVGCRGILKQENPWIVVRDSGIGKAVVRGSWFGDRKPVDRGS